MRILFSFVLLLAGCKNDEPPFNCLMHMKGAVDGAVVKLGPTVLGTVQETNPTTGMSQFRCSLTKDAMAKLASEPARLVFETPCGAKEVPLQNTTKNSWLELTVAPGSALPTGTRVYSDGHLGKVKIGAATLTEDKRIVDTPSSLRGSHSGWLFDATCLPNAPIEVAGTKVGALDTAPLATQDSVLGASIFVPNDPASCYEAGSMGYGEGAEGRLATKLQGQPAYVVGHKQIDSILVESPSRVKVRAGDRVDMRTFVVACK